jgi:UDP-3-O-[3-hydroxymyristoyl] N-acetylglucosamine deacetylase
MHEATATPAAVMPLRAKALPVGSPEKKQHTLRAAAACSGIGVHTGEKVSFRILPSDPDTGIVFVRTDLKNGARNIPARWDRVVDTKLCTVIGNGEGGLVATIEHLMAALRAAGVDNATVEIDGPEVPVMDGSAAAFVDLIDDAGLAEQTAPRREIRVLKPVEVFDKNKSVRLEPSAGSQFSFTISFAHKLIRNQQRDFMLSPPAFKTELSRARTFGFFEEVEQLQQMGFARGGSLDNAIVIKGDAVMNKDGLRYDDEFVRHKILDAVGDLALAGAVLRGKFVGNCSGHSLNNQLLRALFADPEAWCLTGVDTVPATITRY